MLMANEAKPERTVKFLNAMLMLSGDNAIKLFTLGVPENPGVLDDKSAIFDSTPLECREMTDRAEMLRIFRDVLEEKEIPTEKLLRLLDKDFANDVSLTGYTDETLLNEVDGMTDLLYEKQGSYLQGKQDVIKALIKAGKLTPEEGEKFIKITNQETSTQTR